MQREQIDRNIIDRYMARDEQAIAMTREQYGNALMNLASRFVNHEDAEECVSDTYLAAWNNIPPQHPKHLLAWLSTVCRNKAFSCVRYEDAQKRTAEVLELSTELAQCIPDQKGEEERQSEEIGRIISRWLRTQSKEKRIMFLRRYWFGDSIRQTAEFTGASESKVKVTLLRMREQLKEELEQEGVWL